MANKTRDVEYIGKAHRYSEHYTVRVKTIAANEMIESGNWKLSPDCSLKLENKRVARENKAHKVRNINGN